MRHIGKTAAGWSASNHNSENIGCEETSHPIFSVGSSAGTRADKLTEQQDKEHRNQTRKNHRKKTENRRKEDTDTTKEEARAKERGRHRRQRLSQPTQDRYHRRKQNLNTKSKMTGVLHPASRLTPKNGGIPPFLRDFLLDTGVLCRYRQSKSGISGAALCGTRYRS